METQSVWQSSYVIIKFISSEVKLKSYSNGVLALSKSVPQLDGLVAGSRDDLSVVSREGDRENVLGVGNELAGAYSSRKIQ